MKIIKLEDSNNYIFDKICNWNYNWWGKRDGESIEKVRYYMEHSLCANKIPQTFVALIEHEPVGMYQITSYDDISRPDIYPWLANVYVDKNYRGKGIFKELMNTVCENSKKLNIKELYLYTSHLDLYEKFGWEYIEDVKTFREDSPIERLYRLRIE